MRIRKSATFCSLFALAVTIGCGTEGGLETTCDGETIDIVEATINGEPYVACEIAWAQHSFEDGRGAEVLQIYASDLRALDNEAVGGERSLMVQVVVNGDTYAAKNFEGHHNMSGQFVETSDDTFTANLTLGEIELHHGRDDRHVIGAFDGTSDRYGQNVTVSEGVFDLQLREDSRMTE